MRLRTALAALAATSVLAAVSAYAAPSRAGLSSARPEPGAPGIGDPYFPQDGNGGIDVTHYDIHDAYALGSGFLHGHTTLSVTATHDLSRFDLDFLLPVSRVTVDGRPAAYHRRGDHELVITPPRPLAAGAAFAVRVTYAGRPADYRSQGERNWLADRHEVVAMNEPHMATWWFPANDHPRDKAGFDIHITAPRSLKVIANGTRVGRHVSGALATTRWRETAPMVPYLAFFAVGRFEVRHGVDTSEPGGRPWYVAVSRRLPKPERAADLGAMLQTPAMTSWLESLLGPYPFSSTGGLVTSLDPGFALENQTRPTFPAFDPANVTLVVHELTHQWFGDSVSVQNWRDIWVNEGFAQWMQTYWNETHGGSPAAQWLQGLYDGYTDKPMFWELPIDDPGAGHLFDVQVYDRGAMAVQALRNRIGDAPFWTLLRTWVASRQYGNGSDAQFEALASQVSGQDLSGFFDAWLHAPVAPARTAANGLA